MLLRSSRDARGIEEQRGREREREREREMETRVVFVPFPPGSITTDILSFSIIGMTDSLFSHSRIPLT